MAVFEKSAGLQPSGNVQLIGIAAADPRDERDAKRTAIAEVVISLAHGPRESQQDERQEVNHA